MADMQIVLNDLEIRKILAERLDVEVNRISLQFLKKGNGDKAHGGGDVITATVRKDFTVPAAQVPNQEDR